MFCWVVLERYDVRRYGFKWPEVKNARDPSSI
jgi:hypothetical protein